MKTIMAAKSPHDSSFSFSRRYFHFNKKLDHHEDDNHNIEEQVLTITPSFHHEQHFIPTTNTTNNNKNNNHSTSRFKSAFTLFTKSRSLHHHSLAGTRIIGTLFGNRRGHVHIAFQEDPKSHPPFLVELPTPTSVLVREMASGVVRIALECEKKKDMKKNKNKKRKKEKLVEEAVWRSYCNGRKCGYANRVECGEEEWKVLKAVGPISMGAGVIPATCGGGSSGDGEGEVMYMRARFERVVWSKDSEAYYLINHDGSGGHELSVFLLRV